jgi:hypothetical protein
LPGVTTWGYLPPVGRCGRRKGSGRMHRLRPILALPIAIFMFAGAALIAVSKDAIPAQLTPYVALAAIIVMAGAMIIAVRIALAATPKPTLTFADVLTLVFGTSRYEITGTGIKFSDLDDFARALAEAAAIEDISIWGSRVPVPAFPKIKSAMLKIPPTYWEGHRINTLAYAENAASITQNLLTGLDRTPPRDAYFYLHFDKEEMRLLKRKWKRRA